MPDDPPIPPPDIFTFESLPEFLDAWFTHARAQSTTRSYRWFARKLDISPGYLANFAKGRRPLPKALVQPFAEMMGLGVQESAYFEALAELARSKSELGKREARARLSGLRRHASTSRLDEASARIWDKWYTLLIREVVHVTGNRDPEALASIVVPPITPDEAAESVRLLEELDLLDAPNVASEHRPPTIQQLRSYHRSMIQLGSECIERFGQDERYIVGLNLNVDGPSKIHIQRELQRAAERCLDIAAQTEDPARVIQVNIQLFPLTADLSSLMPDDD